MSAPTSCSSCSSFTTSAGISVLTDDALVRRVAEFQGGYPQAAAELALRADSAQLGYAWGRVFGLHKTLDGALPRLVVATGDVRTLRLLFDLKARPQYRDDPLLRFSHVMRAAVQLKRVDMLDCLAKLKARDPDWQWEPNLMSHAAAFSRGDLRVLEWLDTHLPSHLRVVLQRHINVVAYQGDLQLLRWLCERGHGNRAATADSAASSGHVEVLAYLYEHTSVRCSLNALCQAAANGAVEIVKIVALDQTEETCARALSAAAHRGVMDVVRYFVERGVGVSSSTTNALDSAADGGRLSTLEFLHEHLSSGCSPWAMDSAAIRGRLDIVRFLHERRSEGCTTNAMNGAAAFGHLDVVRFLHEHRSEGCSVRAMDSAAEFGRLEVLRFLHEHRSEGCSSRALEMAAANGHIDVITFLCEHRAGSDVRGAIVSAASSGKVSAVAFLYNKSEEARAAVFFALRAAAYRGRRDVMQFLCEQQQQQREGERESSFLMRAVEEETAWLVNALLPYASTAELEQAGASVFVQVGRPWMREAVSAALSNRNASTAPR